MQRIVTKAKIVLWCVVGDKEKIDFSLCDFSAEQVAALDRIVRAKDEKVRLTIEPEQRKLQIAPIESMVRIVSMACRSGGQKIKIADFTSPDSRAESLKRMSGAETPLTLTLEPVQGHLPFAEDDAGEGDPSLPGTPIRTLKFPGMRKVGASIALRQDGPRWQADYTVRMGNYEIASEPGEVCAESRAMALEAARIAMIEWLEGLTLATKADRQRRVSMQQKINAEMGILIDGAKRADASEKANP
jgi:hypothetical protein